MKNIIFGVSVLFLLLTSCAKDVDDEPDYFGYWIETSPVEGRTEILFLPNGDGYLLEGGTVVERYEYRVEDKMIYLQPAGGGEDYPETGFFFELMDENTLKMGDIHPRIPEDDPVIIILERK